MFNTGEGVFKQVVASVRILTTPLALLFLPLVALDLR